MDYDKSISLLLLLIISVQKSNYRIKHPEISEPVFSCELLLSYLAKEIAKEYVKRLENNQLLESESNLEENE